MSKRLGQGDKGKSFIQDLKDQGLWELFLEAGQLAHLEVEGKFGKEAEVDPVIELSFVIAQVQQFCRIGEHRFSP